MWSLWLLCCAGGRFKGMPGEQYTMFFKDPSGNNLEVRLTFDGTGVGGDWGRVVSRSYA